MGLWLQWLYSLVVCLGHTRKKSSKANTRLTGLQLYRLFLLCYILWLREEFSVWILRFLVLGTFWPMIIDACWLRSSIWVFTLLAMEAVKTFKTNPYFTLGTTQIPTWITPLVLVLFTSFLIPHTSFLGHVCGLLVGYGCKYSMLRSRQWMGMLIEPR